MSPLDDAAFLAAIRAGELPGGRFAHADHLRLAWLVLRRDGVVRGEERVAELLRHLASAQGASARYHETMTRAWTRLVATALAATPQGATFPDFLARHAELASQAALHRHFSPELLATPAARAGWVGPDREPLPGSPAAGGSAPTARARRLRTAFLLGAATDALALIPMLVPSIALLLWGFAERSGPYRFAMGYAASLMLAWTALLLWASRRPLERAFVAPLTVLVIWGLVATEIAVVIAGDLAPWRVMPTLVLQAGLLWLFTSAYHGWRLRPPRRAASA